MITSPAARASARGRVVSLVRALGVLALTTQLLTGCGGGDSGSGSSNNSTPPPNNQPNNVSLSVSPTSVQVSATIAQPAPSAGFQVSAVGIQQGQQIYLAGKYSANGIASLSDASGASPITVTIQFKSPSSLGPGIYSDTVEIQLCYDQGCTQQVTNSPQQVQVQYTVTNTVVQISSISPASAVASGAAFNLTVNGQNFSAQSQVQWNGTQVPTTFVSATQLTAQITAADIAAPGSVPVSVNDPVNGLSNSVSFNVLPAALSLASVSPTQVTAGGPAFMLTVLGAGFTNASIVQWNGAAQPTTYVSTSELIAQIPSTEIAAVGSASVTVSDPTSTVGTTSPQQVTIAVASIDAVSFQMNAAHTGSVTFNSVTFPASAAWSVDVGGTPSYALIVSGKVIVTVRLSSSSSELIALDQATGATAWGPIAIPGQANATYDAGKVFVISSPFASAATFEAFDVGTGSQLWSTLLTGQYSFTAAPTAADGLVYTGGAGSGGTLYAVAESNGAIVWTQTVQNGDNSTPAVTADGVYVTYPCWTYNFRPATGESIWNNNTGCEGGGGATPVVANQLLYSPNQPSGYNGSVFNAESGNSVGAYVADSPPAFTSTTGYFLQSGTLRGITLNNNTIQWSFAGDGQLTGSPIAVNGYVLIGSGSGKLYALNGANGTQAWEVTLPAGVAASVADLPFSGLAAGDGLLVVPAGTKVSAYVLSP